MIRLSVGDLFDRHPELSTYRATFTGTKKLPRKHGWKWLALDDVFCIGDDWQQSRPETVRAIAVASNGIGDYLGFLLKEDSMTELDDTIVKFKHESGMMEPLSSRHGVGF